MEKTKAAAPRTKANSLKFDQPKTSEKTRKEKKKWQQKKQVKKDSKKTNFALAFASKSNTVQVISDQKKNK